MRPGAARAALTASDSGARFLLLGGTPFEEDIIMRWNFVGRSSDEVKQFRDEWQSHSDRFGKVEGYTSPTPGGMDRIPAPQFPPVTLRPRVRR